jgi:adenylyltransferase/sulfurtransferase
MSAFERYQRQILLPEIGCPGQKILQNSHVTVVGAGGLGSAVAYYLAVAGIGHLRLIDHDLVDISNLNRQILHQQQDIGHAKVDSAQEKLSRTNPEITLEGFQETLDEKNIDSLLHGSDIIVDCLDNFPTRFVLNDWCLSSGTPFVHGACRGWEGRVTLILPGKTPCLRCLVPVPPPPELFPIIGVTAGVIGTIQATETLKFLLKLSRLLAGTWLLYDGQSLIYRLLETGDIGHCSRCQPV